VLESIDSARVDGMVTVVDNASTDGTRELINKKYPFLNYRLNDKNLGLAKALNIGIKECLECEYVLLLNDDVELFHGTINSMLKTLENFPDAAGIPALLVYPDGSPQRVKLKILGVSSRIKNGVQYIRFAGTTACMYRTDVFKKIGFFDEFYFFYNEDLDFSLRAKRSGMKFIFDPEIKVIHHRKKGREKAFKTIRPYYYATDYYFYRKNYGVLFSTIYLIMALFHIILWKRRYKKLRDSEKLKLLLESYKKLVDTIRHFKTLREASSAL
jgi:GT2 family glycosyltransferase